MYKRQGKGYETGPATLQIGFRDKNGNISYSAVPRNVYNYDEQQSTRYQHLLQEQIGKIRDRNVEPVADILVNELMEKVPADGTVLPDGYTVEYWPRKGEGGIQMMSVEELKEKYGYLEGVDPVLAIQHDMREIPYSTDNTLLKPGTIPDTYTTLEQILNDLVAAYAKVGDIEQVIRKLDRTLENGSYLQIDGKL